MATADLLLQAQAIVIGKVTLTVPGAFTDTARLDARGWRSLDHLLAAEAAGFIDLAEQLRDSLERRLGVTVEDRIVSGAAPSPALLTPAEIERLDAAEETLRATSAPLPANLTAREAYRIRSQRQRLQRDAKLAILDAARERARRVERAEAADVARGVSETAALSRLRFEPLDAELVGGRVRARRKTALQKAFEAGYLDDGPVRAESLMRVGEAYRESFEIYVGQRGPDRTGEGGGGGFGPKALLTPVLAKMRLDEMRGEEREREGQRRRVALGEKLSRRERQACDMVCGLDISVNAAAERLKADRRSLGAALRRGLTNAGANMGWW
jgi:hypothetical protein